MALQNICDMLWVNLLLQRLLQNLITALMLTVLFSVMSTNLYPILILIFIPSLEELKDLNDKPELMQSFVSKDESVSY